ncbi:ABC transporter [Paenibacillus sp. FSL H8-0548]|uniref:ABC transporter ATP-binding protein n=1 Tax=Paenibacillus sp. FSL H8-0548 TaxID=1920422 RepID=UPI00096C4289|nr:ATP-binding cassette domain-containing protein [Paenibacillus sp. FSL H8-0548]OMF37065.1 ABC transporter [Paenibacillus sp. FSL H8-0548]
MIKVHGISKAYQVAKRSAGIKQAAKALFKREYKMVEALNDISFSIAPGEIVGYIGPNGAGKSTTIKVMSGILVPDSGICTVMGFTPWKDRVEYVKNIGVVFGQRSQLWWDVPVIDSFELLRDIYKVPEQEYRSTLALLTETLELQEIIQMPVRQLSLGQRMRCEIAASLLHSPSVLFLDEPTIGLDAVSKIAVRRFIRTINEEKGVTIILTTHDMNDIEALANRIILIGKGKLLYDGSLNGIRSQFGTRKTMTVEYRHHPEPLQIKGVIVESWSPERAVLTIDTAEVVISDVLIRLSEQVEIVDITIDTLPIEDMIVELYKEHQI